MSQFKTDEWASQPDDVARALPFCVGPEKSTLSDLLKYPELLDEAPSLTPEHYYLPGHRALFEVLADRIRNGKTIELVSLVQVLLDTGKLDLIGGPGYLTELYTYSPATGNFQAHIENLTNKLACRMAIRLANEIVKVAYSAPEPSELIEITSTPITLLHDTLTGSRPSNDTKALLKAFYEAFQDRIEGKSLPPGISISLSLLNRMFRGLQKGQVYVLSAYPGGGKTTLAMQLAVDASLGGANTLACSLEMSDAQLMQRCVPYVAKIHGKAVSDPKDYMREHDLNGMPKKITDALGTAIRSMVVAPFQIEDLIGSNVHQIAAIIRRAHRKKPLDVVVVDFIQRITPAPEKARENREQQLSHASNILANLANELRFCLILPSQLNKEGAAKHAETINEDADLHLKIMQDAQKNHLGIKVEKDRHNGHSGKTLPIVLDAEYLRFKEVDPDTINEEAPSKRPRKSQEGNSYWDED
jgi:replicative DNA helicase